MSELPKALRLKVDSKQELFLNFQSNENDIDVQTILSVIEVCIFGILI